MSEDNDQQRPVTTTRIEQNEKQSSKQDFKLPKLSMPASRGRLMSRKQNKAPTYLPNINDDAESNKNFRNTETIHVSKSDNDIAGSEENTVRDQFAYDIEQKLKNMMGKQQSKSSEQNDQQQHQRQSDHLSDDLDFEQKILQNKEIIKMHRKKTEFPDKKIAKPLDMLQRLHQINKLKQNNKPLSNYQRKMKDYNMSLQNKFLQRKKQSLGIIPEKPQKPVQRAKSKKILSLKDAAIDEVKLNFGYKQFKNGNNNNQAVKSQSKDTSRALNPMNINKNHKQPSILPQKKSIKETHKTQQPPSPSKRINKTSALFDNIQSFLENPIASQKHQKLYKELYKKLKTKSIPQLQEQIKQLNQKMGNEENYETQSTFGKQETSGQILLTEHPMERTVRDWKRIDVKDKHNLHYQQSNFEKELDYISYLQEKNSTSLSKFIDQQKLMVELHMNRRISKSIGKDHPPQPHKQNKQQDPQLKQTNTGQQSS